MLPTCYLMTIALQLKSRSILLGVALALRTEMNRNGPMFGPRTALISSVSGTMKFA